MYDSLYLTTASLVVCTGSLSETTSATLSKLTTPTSFPELLVSAIALRWKALKASLHADLPAEFDPRVRFGRAECCYYCVYTY